MKQQRRKEERLPPRGGALEGFGGREGVSAVSVVPHVDRYVLRTADLAEEEEDEHRDEERD